MSLVFDGKVDTPDNVINYKDSNFARSKPDQKLTEDYVFILTKAIISHLSKL